MQNPERDVEDKSAVGRGEHVTGTTRERMRERLMEKDAPDLPFRVHHGEEQGSGWAVFAAIFLIVLAVPMLYIGVSLFSGMISNWTGFLLAAFIVLIATAVALGGLYLLLNRNSARTSAGLAGTEEPAMLGHKKKVHEVMTSKPITVGTIDSIEECSKEMYHYNVGFVVVLDEKDQFVGVLTDRDIVCAGIANGFDAHITPVGNIVERNAVTVSPQHTIHDCLSLMQSAAVRRLPVLEGGLCVGVVSIDDLIVQKLCSIDEVAAIFSAQLSEPGARRKDVHAA